MHVGWFQAHDILLCPLPMPALSPEIISARLALRLVYSCPRSLIPDEMGSLKLRCDCRRSKLPSLPRRCTNATQCRFKSLQLRLALGYNDVAEFLLVALLSTLHKRPRVALGSLGIEHPIRRGYTTSCSTWASIELCCCGW